ncbi:hypothetical protein RQP46_004438 [Phenoliferia psychrophenolica]
MFQSAGGSVAPDPQGQYEDDDEHWKVKHRYLPILSGLACPFSVLLDVPGLTERWYIKTDGFDVIETQPNPAYIINIVTVTVFGVVHRFNDGFTYGTAFWLCVASTVASLICNVTLIFDYASTKDFVRNGSGLTEKQRSLVIAVMALLCYIGLGSLVFSFLIDLTWLFSFFYDVAGLVLIAFTIALARETVIETFGWDRFRKTDAGAANPCSLQRTLTDQSIISEDSYKTFRKEMEKEQAREFRLKISIASLLFWVFWLVGSAVFHFTEGWTYFEALYFCFIFFTTIGYGDFSPQSAAGRAFFVAWAILGIATMTLLLSVVTETWSSRYKSSITQSKVQRSMRRVRTRSEQSGAITAMKSLLALEGVEDEDSIAPKDLPGKLTEAVKGAC